MPRQLVGARIELGVGQRHAFEADGDRIGRAPHLPLEHLVQASVDGTIRACIVQFDQQPMAIVSREDVELSDGCAGRLHDTFKQLPQSRADLPGATALDDGGIEQQINRDHATASNAREVQRDRRVYAGN